MSLKRNCHLCGQPVEIRRRMSLFCSPRCEERYKILSSRSRRPAATAVVLPLPDAETPAPARHPGRNG